MNIVLKESIKNDSLYVYEQENLIVGFVHYHKRLDGWHTLHELAIDKNYQYKGIGQKLFDVVPTPIRLKTTEDNKVACLFYEKNGMNFIKKELGKKRELLVFEKLQHENKNEKKKKNKIK